MKTHGIHHITGFCGLAKSNISFYRDLLGLRLLKKTVNFDDFETPHLYYGDGLGRPGTVITFFAWEQAKKGVIGRQQVGLVGFSIPKGSLDFWQLRLEENSISALKIVRIVDGKTENALQFADYDGLHLELVEADHSEEFVARTTKDRENYPRISGDVPAKEAIFGIHRIEMWLANPELSKDFLVDGLGFSQLEGQNSDDRIRLSQDGLSKFIDLIPMPGRHKGYFGPGTIHHVAFATSELADHKNWGTIVKDFGIEASPIYDRQYFDSIYMLDPGKIVIEIATEGPGFDADEPMDHLGESLRLPSQYEVHRDHLIRKFAHWLDEPATIEASS